MTIAQIVDKVLSTEVTFEFPPALDNYKTVCQVEARLRILNVSFKTSRLTGSTSIKIANAPNAPNAPNKPTA